MERLECAPQKFSRASRAPLPFINNSCRTPPLAKILHPPLQSRQLATPGHVIFAYNIVQRCLSLLVWLLGVDYVLCTPCTAGSKRHRLSGSLLWVYVTISIFRGVGLSFHAFNESRPPWRKEGGVICSRGTYL